MVVRMRSLAAAAATGAWMALIYWLSSQPGSSVPGRFGMLAHFTLYAVLGALILLTLGDALPLRKRAFLSVALASLYGITDEWHQRFVPGRVSDPVDWLVDTAGAALAVWVLARMVLTREPLDPGPGG